MSEASRHLLAIINDVLDMSKIEANKLELAPTDFSFTMLIDKIVSMTAQLIQQKNLQFKLELSEQIPDMLYADDQRLSQVIMNLMSNAIKFTPENGSIQLRTRLLGSNGKHHKIAISVIDNGIGISDEQQSLLFSPFQQAENTTTRKYGGTGLGLAISRRIIELMSGEITLESAIDQGSTFEIVLPVLESDKNLEECYDTSGQGNLSAEAQDGEFSGYQMLLAEDVEVNREIVLALLEPSGIQIACAENGLQAVDMFNANPQRFDIIFMDMQMPEMDGCEATRLIRSGASAKAKRIPIIALTANVFQEDIRRCLDSGMNSHIGKPISLASVTAKLREYLQVQK
jgi:CheY-like chemotaxis protein/two-component sensor histidine kinase